MGGRAFQFAPPPTDARLVERREIFDALSREARLWVMTAPGGFGKTVALHEWARRRKALVIHLKREHADVRLLAKTVAQAMATRLPPELESDATILVQLQWSPLGEESAAKLLSEIEAFELEPTIAFDESNNIAPNSEAAKFLDQFVEGCLELGGRVCLSGRSMPKLRVISKHATNPEFVDLGAAELAFRKPEIGEMYRRMFDIEPTETLIEAVLMRTRGWGALVALTGKWLAARPKEDREQAALTLSGNERSIYEYLATEILDDRPEMHRQLLLSTSIGERIPAAMVEELLPQAGTEIMRELEFGQFVTRQDSAVGPMYAFHPLLAEFLEARAHEELGSQTLERLHRAFANWFAKNELWHDAFWHWMHIDMHEPIAAQMLAWELDYVEWWTEYGRWMKQIDPKLLNTMPRLLLRYAAHSANLGAMNESIDWIERAARAAEELDSDEARIDVKCVTGIVYFFCNRSDEALAICESLESQIPELTTYQVLSLATAFTLLYNNDFIDPNRALHFLQIYEETANRAGYLRGKYIATANRAVASKIVGDFEGQIGALDRLQAENPETPVPLLYQALLTFSSAYGLLELGASNAFAQMETAIQLIGKLNARGQMEYGARCLEFHAAECGREIEYELPAAVASSDSPYREEAETYATLARAAVAYNRGKPKEVDAHLNSARSLATGAHMQGIVAIESARLLWACGQREVALKEARRALQLAELRSMGAIAFRARVFLAANDQTVDRSIVARALADSREPYYDQMLLNRERKFAGGFLIRALALGLEREYVAQLLAELGERPIRIQTFGGLRVFIGLDEVRADDWERPQAKALFAYFAINASKSIHAEAIIDEFWPETELKSGKANLKTGVARLRKAIQPAGSAASLSINEELYRFDLESSAWRDWVAFESFADAVLDKRSSIEVRIESAEACLGIANGEFLPEYRFEDWVAVERERLGQIQQDVLAKFGADLIESERYEEALAIGERMIRFDPLDETGAQLVVDALLKMGKKEEARRAFRSFERKIVTELGLTPSDAFAASIAD